MSAFYAITYMCVRTKYVKNISKITTYNDILTKTHLLMKSMNTNCSRRVNVAYNTSVRNGAPLSKGAMRRDKAKMKKIASLTEVAPSPVHISGWTFLGTRPVFCNGAKNRMLPNLIPSGIMLSAIEDLKVIKSISGARMLSSRGENVFIVIPRIDAINRNTLVQRTLTSLCALDKGKGQQK
jgi:hypothetical protein